MVKALLRAHFQKTPLMQPQDAVKLAFQSAYGCGHLLADEMICERMICAELENTPERRDEPAFTLIGNGLCRLHLASPAVRAAGAQCIRRMMLLTEKAVGAREGNDKRFAAALGALSALAEAGEAPFSAQALRGYLDAYRRAGQGVVSHTQAYRDAYRPAYRVVLSDLAALLPVVLRQPRLAVLDGPCGGGKSTLAGLLAALYGTQPIPMDDFFLPPGLRTPQRLAQPGGNVHRERFEAEVLQCLRTGGEIRWQRFDCRTGALIPRAQPRAPVTVIEGSYSHHPAFAETYRALRALRVFVDVDAREQLRRIEKRNPDLRHMFETRWIPLEKTYFEAYDIRGSADVVIASLPWDAEAPHPDKAGGKEEWV